MVRLLADAEIAEDYVEEIFDIDGTRDAAKAAQGETEIFGTQLRQLSWQHMMTRRKERWCIVRSATTSKMT